MKKIESVKEKRFFTTSNVYDLINKNIQNLSGINWKIQQYNYLYIIHKIIYQNTCSKIELIGCKINIQYLAKLFGKSHQQTSSILRNLINWGIIYISSPSDINNNTSAQYQLTTSFINDTITVINVSESDISFISKLIKYENEIIIKDRFLNKSLNIIKSSLSININGFIYLNNKYNIVNINIDLLPIYGDVESKSLIPVLKKAISEAKKRKKLNGGYGIERRDIALFLILIEEFYCTRPPDKNGKKSRVYSNLTNLPREHRKYIQFAGRPLRMTDICNSQILLTVPIIQNYYKIHSGKGSSGMPDDVLKFQKWAESGQFYENMGKLLTPITLTSEQRLELKEMTFRVLWFGANSRYFPRLKMIFRKNFPNVFKIITQLKIADYAQFSIRLQYFEAKIMIDTVAKKMLIRKKVLTLHDAIICSNEEDLLDAEKRIAIALGKYNLEVKFKREDESIETQSSQIIKTLSNADDSNRPTYRESANNKEFRPKEKKHYNDIGNPSKKP